MSWGNDPVKNNSYSMYIPLVSAQDNLPGIKLKILAADIGATKTNMAMFTYHNGAFSTITTSTLPTSQYRDANEMISSFLGQTASPDTVCLAVAGPVMQNQATITNISWNINGKTVSEYLNHTPVQLINDLEATAWGMAMLKEENIYSISGKGQKHEGNIALIAPGTGLGEAGLYWDGTQYHPFATEGGHCDFAARNESDYELLQYLQNKYGHVSWERVASGRGITEIFDFLQTVKKREVPAWLQAAMADHDAAAVISSYATGVPVCEETIALFLRYVATEAGNCALKFKALGGVFLGGGIMPKITRLINKNIFLRHFLDFGRLDFLLRDIPVKIIMEDTTALLGAAYYGALHAQQNV